MAGTLVDLDTYSAIPRDASITPCYQVRLDQAGYSTTRLAHSSHNLTDRAPWKDMGTWRVSPRARHERQSFPVLYAHNSRVWIGFQVDGDESLSSAWMLCSAGSGGNPGACCVEGSSDSTPKDACCVGKGVNAALGVATLYPRAAAHHAHNREPA